MYFVVQLSGGAATGGDLARHELGVPPQPIHGGSAKTSLFLKVSQDRTRYRHLRPKIVLIIGLKLPAHGGGGLPGGLCR